MDKLLSHPTAVKIISVAVALLLWAVVHIDPETSPQAATSSIDTKIVEAATITATGIDPNKFVLTAMEPTVVRIVVEGRISNLLKATNDDYIVEVDLSEAQAGSHELPLSLKLPNGITEVEVSPKKVTVHLEAIVTEDFDVQVITEGQIAEGMVLGTPVIVTENGSTVNVTLPEDDMSKVAVVGVTLDVSDASKTVVNKKAKIVAYDKEGVEVPGAVIEPQTIHAEVAVTFPYKQVPLQIRTTGDLPDGVSLVSVQPQLDQVTVYADASQLDGINIYDGAVLDLSKVKETGVVKVKTSPQDAIQAVSPSEIEVMVIVEAMTTRTFEQVPIKVNRVVEGVDVNFLNPENGMMDIVLQGAPSVLTAIAKSDITATYKIDALAPGEYTVPIELGLPNHVQVVLEGNQRLTALIEVIDTTVEIEQEETEEPVELGSGNEGTEETN